MAGFFGFFDFTKPGKGIYKNTPKKKGLALFFELYFRKFWKLVQLNMLYLVCCIPYIALILLVVIPFAYENPFALLLYIGIVLYLALIGFAPLNIAMTYIIRNYMREEHAWVLSDFFEQFKKNFKQGIVIAFIDIAAVVVFYMNLTYYAHYQSMFSQAALVLTVIIFVIYIIMHFYLYQIIVTFETKLRSAYKNAMIFALLKLPQNLAVLLIIIGVFLAAFYYNLLIGIAASVTILVTTLVFIINFYVTPVIQKYAIDPTQNTENDN